MKKFILTIACALAVVISHGQCVSDTCSTTTTFYLDLDGDGVGVDDPATNIECCATASPSTMHVAAAGDVCPFDGDKTTDAGCGCGTICPGDVVKGCIYASACNYNALANTYDGTCIFPDESKCEQCLNGDIDPDGPCNCDGDTKDALGVCGGSCAADADGDGICDNVDPCPNDAANEQDACGVCGGSGVDVDEDGICDDEDNCTDTTACNYQGDALAGGYNEPCETPDALGDCDGDCLADADGDGVCDVDEISGCADATKCNYDPQVTENDPASCLEPDICGICGGDGVPTGACDCDTYPATGYDCDGDCLNDADGDGVCDEFEVVGCTDATACNYDANATESDPSACMTRDVTNVCGGTCTTDVDGDGICDHDTNGDGIAEDLCTTGTGVVDACGVCGGSGIPAGDCDCFGNELDALGVCGGGCVLDADGDGICDVDANGNIIDECAGAYDAVGVCGGTCTTDADGDGICDDNGGDDCDGVVDECGVCGGSGPAEGKCDCAGNVLDAAGVCGGVCSADVDEDGICDDVDTCIGVVDDCGVCNGSGVPAGFCDCSGNTEDVIGVCGGNCVLDADGDGICDLDADGNEIDTCDGELDACGVCNGPGPLADCGCTASIAGFCDCDGNVMDACGVCGGDGPEFGKDCDGNCLSDVNGDGICDDIEEMPLNARLVVNTDPFGNMAIDVNPFNVQYANDSLERLLRLMVNNLDDGSLTGASKNVTLESSVVNNGTLTVDGPSTFEQNVDMNRYLTINGDINIGGAADILGSTISNGGVKTSDLQLDSDMEVGGDAAFEGSLFIDGQTEIKNTLTARADFNVHQGNDVNGDMNSTEVFSISSATGNTDVLGRWTTLGSADVDGTATFGRLNMNGLTVMDQVRVDNFMDLNASAAVLGNFRVNTDKFIASITSGNTSIGGSGDLTVAKDLTIGGNFVIDGSCTIEGVTFANGGIETTSMALTGDLDVGGNATTGQDLNVYGAGTFNRAFSFGGDLTLVDGSTSNVFSTDTVFSVSAATGDLMISNRLKAQSLSISGRGEFGQNVAVGGNFSASGSADLDAGLRLDGLALIEGNATIQDDVTSFDTLRVNDVVTVHGTPSFQRGLTVDGSTTTRRLNASNMLTVTSRNGYVARFKNDQTSATQGGVKIKVGNNLPGNANQFMSFNNSSGTQVGRIEGEKVQVVSGEVLENSTNELANNGDYNLEMMMLNQEIQNAQEGVTSAKIATSNAAIDVVVAIAEAAAASATSTTCAGVVIYGFFPVPFVCQTVPIPSTLASALADVAPSIANLAVAISGNVQAGTNLSDVKADKDNFLDATYGDMNTMNSSGALTSNSANHYKVGVTYQSGSADYAEWLPKQNPSQDFEPGQVVGVKNGAISLDTYEADKVLVISTQPVVLGNMPKGDAFQYEKTAFMGQVPVRVLGAVHSGDYIVASGLSDGNAMALAPEKMTAADLDRLVGIAWEDGLNPFRNVVNCAVGMPNVGSDLYADLHARTDAQEQKTKELKDLMLLWSKQQGELDITDAMDAGVLPRPITMQAEEIVWTKPGFDDIVIHELTPEAIEIALNQSVKLAKRNGLANEDFKVWKDFLNGDETVRRMIAQGIAQRLNDYNKMAVEAMIEFEGKEFTRVRYVDRNNPEWDADKASPKREKRGKKWHFKQWGGSRNGSKSRMNP